MRKTLQLIIILLALIPIVSVANKATNALLSNKINKVLKDYDDSVSIGILVKDQKTGEVLYSKNANHFFMPASNEKLFTAVAALQFLGPNFFYQTRLFADTSKINQGVLNDNIYLQFSGDPTLTLAQLDHLIHALSQAGVHQINGKIIIDDSAFDQMTMSPGSTWDDKDFCWGSPVSAITIEHNCVTATLNPATKPDELATMSLPDYPQSLVFINEVVTSSPGAEDCIPQIKRSGTTAYTISGCIKTTDQPKDIKMAIDDARANIQVLLKYLLTKNQISGDYQFEFSKPDSAAKLLASENSQPLSSLVSTMLKESDNTIAESLFKTIGSSFAKDAGSFKNGSDAVRDIIYKSAQLDIPKTTMIDGSGASRYDFVTPQQIVTLLQKSYTSELAANFIPALPISGVDGTLKERMKDSTTLGKVLAKTGTATAVSTLSGYLETRKKRTLVFSIMINGFVDLPSKYKGLEDQVCAALIESI